jgi:hypothetical protein
MSVQGSVTRQYNEDICFVAMHFLTAISEIDVYVRTGW